MSGRKEQFRSFSDNRLIEIVRNAKQFGYDDEIRNTALELLEERGISEEDLQLTGNLTNYQYDYVRTLYMAYTRNSKIAFIAYAFLIVLKGVILFRIINTGEPALFYLLLFLAVFFLYIICLVRSFLDHVNFYKAIGQELGVGDQIIFFVIGMPFYIFMFFFYRNQMKDAMKMVS